MKLSKVHIYLPAVNATACGRRVRSLHRTTRSPDPDIAFTSRNECIRLVIRHGLINERATCSRCIAASGAPLSGEEG